MQATSWVDRITDEANPWLKATRMEERGDFANAAVLYLEDAIEGVKGDRLAKSALSASCAAMCLDALGFSAQATLVYGEVARLYYEYARRMSNLSVRELMWSLWQSGQCFLASGEEDKAEAVFREYAMVAGRVALFGDNSTVRLFEDGGARRQYLTRDQPPPGDWSALLNAIQRFVNLRRMGTRSAATQPMKQRDSGRRKKDKKGQTRLEANFVNQLG